MSNGMYKPLSTTYVLSPSQPLTSGGSLDLANGQIGLFQKGKRTSRGVQAIANPSVLSSKEKLFLEIGTGATGNRGSMTNRNMRTIEFSPSDVLDLTFTRAKAPTKSKVTIGYDGHDTSKTISLKPGQAASITVELTGDVVAFYGYKKGKYIKTFTIDIPHPDDCSEVDVCDAVETKSIIEKLVETMKNDQFREGIKLGDLLKITGVYSDSGSFSPSIDYYFYTLKVIDSGDDVALGLVQATVPGYKVVRTDRKGLESTYQILSTEAPDDYTTYTPSILTNCGECPEGYTEQDGGFLYTLTINDGGADLSEDLADVEGVVSVTKISSSNGIGVYIIVFASEITTADFIEDLTAVTETIGEGEEAEEVSVFPTAATASLLAYGQVENVCISDAEPIAIEWVESGECGVTTETYYIDVPNNDCDANRLAEIQAAYPSLTIAVDEEYEAPSGSCSTRYTTTVVSNIVCADCFTDAFITEAPKPFEFAEWVKTPEAPASADTKVGIYFEPKSFYICPDKTIADQLQTIVEPMEVQVSGGELEGTLIGYSYNKNAFPVTRLGRAFRGTGFGIDYMGAEQEGQARSLGVSIGNGYVENYLKDTVTKLTPCEQYDAITIVLKNSYYSGGFSRKQGEEVRYIFVIPQGTEGLFKPFFNAVASGSTAGVI